MVGKQRRQGVHSIKYKRGMVKMKRVLITGGTGSIGKAFIKELYGTYEIHNLSRGGEGLVALSREFPNVKNYLGSIEDKSFVLSSFRKVGPEIVVHFSAIKHVDFSERNPHLASKVNVLGSLNIAEASVTEDVPVTIGISTDKACWPENVYGYTKALMERSFISHSTLQNKFLVCRFANVAYSSGSVLKYWKSLAKDGRPLGLTDPNMNRLMFTKKDAVGLIKKAMAMAVSGEEGVVISQKMKCVNMLTLAEKISPDNIETIGRRSGERCEEYLVHSSESKYVYIKNDLILIKREVNPDENEMPDGYSTVNANKMSNEEMCLLINSQD